MSTIYEPRSLKAQSIRSVSNEDAPQYYTFAQQDAVPRFSQYYDKSGVPYESTDVVFTSRPTTLLNRLKKKQQYHPTMAVDGETQLDPMPVAANVNAYTRGTWMTNPAGYQKDDWIPPKPKIRLQDNDSSFVGSGAQSFANRVPSSVKTTIKPRRSRETMVSVETAQPVEAEESAPNKLWTYVASYLPQKGEEAEEEVEVEKVEEELPPLPTPPEAVVIPHRNNQLKKLWNSAKKQMKKPRKELSGRSMSFEEFFANTDDFSAPPLFEEHPGGSVRSFRQQKYQHHYEETISESCNGLHERTRRTKEVFVHGAQRRQRFREETVETVDWSKQGEVDEEAAMKHWKNIKDYHELMTGTRYPAKVPREAQQLSLKRLNPTRLFGKAKVPEIEGASRRAPKPMMMIENGKTDHALMASNIHGLLTRIPYVGGFFSPLTAMAAKFPEAQVVIVAVELAIFAVLLYEIHRMIDSFTMVVMTFCSPFITFVKFFGII